VAIGTWSGVARVAGQPVGLLWIDAHLDSHTPKPAIPGPFTACRWPACSGAATSAC
jgi:arginase family enzyme